MAIADPPTGWMTDGAHQSFTPQRERERERAKGALIRLARPAAAGKTREPPRRSKCLPAKEGRIGGGAVETKRKIMIAGTPKHNDNIHYTARCWPLPVVGVG